MMLAAAVAPLLQDGSPERAVQLTALRDVRESLGEVGAASRVAAMALDLAQHAPDPLPA